MAERSLTQLNYGHPGQATFDIYKKEWIFTRHEKSTVLKQVGLSRDGSPSSTEVIPPSIQFPTAIASTRVTNATSSTKELVLEDHQISAASDILPNLAVTSAAIVSTAASYDPCIGDLFSVGSITFEDVWENPRRVAAAITGESQNILRLAFFYKETQGWGSAKTPSLRGETLKDTECGYWNEDAAPIKQVCFSRSQDRSSLLAVRLPSRTVLFRPYYTPQPQTARPSPYYQLPPSRIDPHPILHLGNDASGGSPHADVTFNPDFQLQFAVIDQNLTWSVWDIEHGRKGDSYTMSCLAQGPLADDVDPTSEDGWARIRWIGDVDTLLMCNRRHLKIINIKAGIHSQLPCPEPIARRSNDWILDVERHPTSGNRFFVLTTAALFLLEVTTMVNAQESFGEKAGARVIVSWLHYRGADDFTLSMSVQSLATGLLHPVTDACGDQRSSLEEVCVLLHSRLNGLVQSVTFHTQPAESSVVVTSANPSLLNLAIGGKGYIANLKVDSLELYGDVRSNFPSPGQSYLSQGLLFYKLIVARSDLSIHETLIYGCGAEGSFGGEKPTFVQPPSWNTMYLPRKYIRSLKNVADMDGFIVDNGAEALDNPTNKLFIHGMGRPRDQEITRTRRVVEHSMIYQALVGNDLDGHGKSGSVAIATVIQQIRSMLLEVANENETRMPLGTLLECAGMKLDVSDIDESSSHFTQFISVKEGGNNWVPTQMASTRVLHLAENVELTLSGLYDTILQYWVASLPPGAPIRNRQYKERLARRIAAEVILAGTRMRAQEPKASDHSHMTGYAQVEDMSIPILSSQAPPSEFPDTGDWPSSQSLPTVDNPIINHSSQVQTSSLDLERSSRAAGGPLARLRNHLRFKDEAPEATIIAPSVDQLLSHWQLGADPRNYDWESTERNLHEETLDEESQQQREKERRRRERRQRKQQRENEIARSQPSSQPFTFLQPTHFPRSSPGPTLGGMMSSSQVPALNYTQVPLPGSQLGSLAVQSQVEPGQHGGRPDKKKKKKRIGGF